MILVICFYYGSDKPFLLPQVFFVSVSRFWPALRHTAIGGVSDIRLNESIEVEPELHLLDVNLNHVSAIHVALS